MPPTPPQHTTSIIGTDIEYAKSLLEKDQIVAIPTETVYGLSGNAFSKKAVLEIFKTKNRPHSNPLIVHVSDIQRAASLLQHVDEIFYDLAQKFWPGPLTILAPKAQSIPDIVTADSKHLAIRIPNHPITLDLLKQLAFPLVAPSANPFGYISPTTPQHVYDQLNNKIPYILDGGPCNVGLESTIISIKPGTIQIHRLGAITLEELQNFTKKVEIQSDITNLPGTMKTHYSPQKKLIIGDIKSLLLNFKHTNLGILSFDTNYPDIPTKNQFVLSCTSDLHEAARNLFAGLRYLDALDVQAILASYVPNIGIGLAINDRLKRAQVQ